MELKTLNADYEQQKMKLYDLKTLYSELRERFIVLGKYKDADKCSTKIERIISKENESSLDILLIPNLESDYISLKRRLLEDNLCSVCSSKNTFYYDEQRGEIGCLNCGAIYSDKYIDRGPEWRAFNSEEQVKCVRTGAPSSNCIYDKGLSTIIDVRDKDGLGKPIPLKMRDQIYRLRKWQNRIATSIDRNLSLAFSELEKLCEKIKTSPSVKEDAALIYRKAVSHKLTRGRSIESVIAASFYIACKGYYNNSKKDVNVSNLAPITMNDLVEATHIKKKYLSRSIRIIVKNLGLSLFNNTPNSYLPKLASDLNLSNETQTKAEKIIQKVSKTSITFGKDPIGVAAASLYIAAKMNKEYITQKIVANAAGITDITVRIRYKEIYKKLHKI
ncbi:Transcription initiation factor IIB [Candidatus Tiddalikarchaeum anstoanum]|nr:Transcription initiation factor IIB [Candidatus Tiddalikarchaeum anstoanum]